MEKRRKVVFKEYAQHQTMLLPPSLDELILETHPVRTVSTVIDQLDLSILEKEYSGGGSSSYHPRMLLKVLVYGYLSNVYSSRKLEAGCKENIHLMWISGMSQPDHNTINRFRGARLKNVIKEIFGKVVMLLVESGHVNLQSVYTDGTKIEANANKYTFVWGKAIKTSRERIQKQLQELWDYTQSVAAEELKDQSPTTFEKIDPEKVKETVRQIEQALQDKPVKKKIKQKLNYAKKHWPSNLARYEADEKILAGRNSYSKTDPEATFMRMKEDPMLNGQLKPGYNLQISTSDQFIVNYSLHSNPTDTATLKTHLEAFKNLYQILPAELTADAGYGSEENYQLLEDHNIDAYVKDNYFDKDQHQKKKNPFAVSSLYYNAQQDCYYCPMGQTMTKTGVSRKRSENGFLQTYTQYKAQRCEGCPLRSQCHAGKSNRSIAINTNLLRLKQKSREMLTSERGLYHRKKRPCDVEPVFGHWKYNKKFKRFMLRGKAKVTVETGLMAIAHNLKKSAA
jgi:transposase